ncbi:MAG TPA: cytochrome P450 [Streptosporangiaceae bacterium]|nr:cytochrome P450 [Streptosporangiaceae bacterium]
MSGPDTASQQRRQDDAEALIASLLTPEVIANPYPVFARLRELGRVHATDGVLFATRYEDCATVTRETALFRAQSPQWCDYATPGWRERPSKVATFETMLFQDPPDHTRLRRLVSAAFTPRQAERMRGDVARLTDRALDALADAGSGGSPVDLHASLAATLPIAVIASLVGVPPSDWAGLQAHMTALLQVVEFAVTKQQLAGADRAALELRDYFATLVASRRAQPRDDLASTLVSVRDAASPGAGFTEDELLQTLTFLFMAGVDTMTNLLANGAAAFIAHPDQADLLRAGPGLTSRAVDEVLRFDPPVQIVGRVAAEQTVVGGATVPANGLVIALLGSANRDPARFQRPDTFDITRTGTTVLSFGGGIHYCLGAPLARVEAGTFLTALLTRFPRLQLAGTPIRQGVVFRGFSKLPVTLS